MARLWSSIGLAVAVFLPVGLSGLAMPAPTACVAGFGPHDPCPTWSWATPLGTPVSRFPVAALSTDGTTLFVGAAANLPSAGSGLPGSQLGSACVIHALDSATGEPRWGLAMPALVGCEAPTVLLPSADGFSLFVAATQPTTGNAGVILRLDAATGLPVWTWNQPNARPYALAVHPAGHLLYVTQQASSGLPTPTVLALHAATGVLAWSATHPALTQSGLSLFAVEATADHLVVAGRLDAAFSGRPLDEPFVAVLDPDAGSLLWSAARQHDRHRFDADLVLDESTGLLLVGGDHGIAAFHLSDGVSLWTAPLPAALPWRGSVQPYDLAYDPAGHRAYLAATVGVPAWPYGVWERGSALAVNADNGSVAWQVVTGTGAAHGLGVVPRAAGGVYFLAGSFAGEFLLNQIPDLPAHHSQLHALDPATGASLGVIEYGTGAWAPAFATSLVSGSPAAALFLAGLRPGALDAAALEAMRHEGF